MNKYLKIQNALYGKLSEPETSYIHIIKPIGFSILTCLIYLEREHYTTTWIGQIMDILKLDKRTINKYLAILQKNEIITCSDDLGKAKQKDTISINLEWYMRLDGDKSGFELIPSSIFLEQFQMIRDCGVWVTLCFLTKIHNINFGAIGGDGFANMSEARIGSYLGLHENTVSTFVHILESNKIIKITPSKSIFKGLDEKGNVEYTYCPNEYIVPFKKEIKEIRKSGLIKPKS